VNYRHAFHAGNFADVVKHATLALIIERLKAKDAPFAVIDTHAGIGRYDLQAPEALRTGEWRQGIGRLIAATSPPAALDPYLRVVREMNQGEAGGLRWYPGSPWLARALLRRGDRLFATELHPADHEALAGLFAGARRVKVVKLDGYQALAAFVPPRERRALVLVDPPFEEDGEFARMAEGLQAAYRRFASGVYVLWYPIKERAAIRRFHAALQASGIRRILRAEVLVAREKEGERLAGCGLIVVNPPYTVPESLAQTLPWLAKLLRQDREQAESRIDWLVPE